MKKSDCRNDVKILIHCMYALFILQYLFKYILVDIIIMIQYICKNT